MNKTIDSEIIEKHAIIAGRIYTLKEEYEKLRAELIEAIFYMDKQGDKIRAAFTQGKIDILSRNIFDLEELVK